MNSGLKLIRAHHVLKLFHVSGWINTNYLHASCVSNVFQKDKYSVPEMTFQCPLFYIDVFGIVHGSYGQQILDTICMQHLLMWDEHETNGLILGFRAITPLTAVCIQLYVSQYVELHFLVQLCLCGDQIICDMSGGLLGYTLNHCWYCWVTLYSWTCLVHPICWNCTFSICIELSIRNPNFEI